MARTRFSSRQVLVYVAVLALLALARPMPATFVAGAALAALGVALRVWGCGHLRKNKDLITSGPYAHIKHPLYLGTLAVALGGIVAAGSTAFPGLLVWVALGPAFGLGFFGYYLPRKTRVEGRRMAERFGDRYPTWAEHVPDWLPRARRWPEAARSRWSWQVYRSNGELAIDLLIVALFAAMFVLGRFRDGGS
jgi:protein-S-isoprenylcysteine O-methyltransferase Ste14